MTAKVTTNNETTASFGYEAQLWKMASAVLGSMDAAEYLPAPPACAVHADRRLRQAGAFKEQRARLEAQYAKGADPKNLDEYRHLKELGHDL